MEIPKLVDLTVSGDPHADNNNLQKIGELFDIFEEIGNPVLILGDLLDTKEIIRGKTLNYVRRRIKNSKLFFIIMIGNHDWFNLDCLEHSLESLKDLPNVLIIDKPTRVQNMLFMPYFNDILSFKSYLVDSGFERADVLFMHQGVIGFDYGNGHVADGNGDGEILLPTTARFKKVYSGHFHKFAEQGNLMFLGTPFSQDHGETNQTKYLGIYHVETMEMELAETPFPSHMTLEVDCSEGDLTSAISALVAEYAGNILRIRLKGTGLQIAACDQSKFKGVEFLEEPNDEDQIETSSIKDTDSNEQKFMVWAKEIKGLEEDAIAEGLEILKSA